MRVAIHTAASKQVGYGHLRRCMTLADALRARGAQVGYVIDGDDQGLPPPEADVDAIIADSYRFDAATFVELHRRARLLVIDDLADRELDADLVTNSAIGADGLGYRTRARLLLGPTYALVRSAFAAAAHPTREVQRVLVTLGGSDPHGRTLVTVSAVLAVTNVALDVVLGPLHGDDAPLEALARANERITLHRNVTDLAPLMALADLAVSGGGQTTFELAAAGVPAVALSIAENQRHVLAGFARSGSLVHAGDAGAPDVSERLSEHLARLVADEALRRSMSEAGCRLVDGHGPQRVAAALEQILD